MKVIFLQDISRVGKKYDIKEVNDGYALNFLFPKKWATLATPKAIAEIEKNKKEIIIEREIQEDLLIKILEEIKGKTIIIKAKSDEKGHLFSTIHKKTLIDSMEREYRIQIEEKFIVLEKQIKEIGEFEIPVVIKNKKSFFKLIVEKI
ncbi:MAG: 50S ribosomal protein L9 [Candidatus Nomurabacteria bacterium GW2011_GWE1_32_28]|uniref:Large ribosomal subunit protein bL9 n=1 Tax=Candidatus Nomurabacteria bacterium GW2011_GWF1_31_48 TaxID=1618767 RepID=A0A0F9YGM2_9BACT|nr:MAG: 50S ribosomal protein L9 [Candidatus Nomurabacteria bacterium GW2011_GWF2_30_133]KKP29017.1 MAG: 50S ribosomal protein L9 [Candidatus Nomurabacteria bacterium GW2011_GWE2_31_40]KKP30573.1 MAG: 50S ribosomal protein L9 [Candidatus Nomurabacteria bacterium GW2011_GWF1_31_48]KKP35058.1 MAG: 50S ribosomal protein L9 [Candidatus Nomurabacteria bacterium GW2011_GWE1_32_28]HAS80578.1 50S ribosomal protein L9 [Candidatus Nomurabacteria bacterium]